MKNLPDLPYPMDALSPYVSGETLCFIYQKIMPAYLEAYTQGKKQHHDTHKNAPNHESLDEYLAHTAAQQTAFYREATELYNHIFWLQHIAPKNTRQNAPSPDFLQKILQDFGSMEKFCAEFLRHGAGIDVRWVWLLTKDDKLSIAPSDTLSPLSLGYKPIAVCNLWQHAYYLDYRDRKMDYINAYLSHLIHWRKCEAAWQNRY